MIDAFTARNLLAKVPSSRAEPPPMSTSPVTYTMSIQRRDSTPTGTGAGRWREIASWQLTTTEPDMTGPLNCGLRPNYRIIINELGAKPATEELAL